MPSRTAHFLNLQLFQFLAGDQKIRAADGRLHHAAGGAENLASGGAHAEGRVGVIGFDVHHVDAEHANELGRLARGQHVVHIRHVVATHFLARALELLRRARHDRHADDLGRVEALALGEERLDHSAHHLLRALAGGQAR